jgi:hypothetical protein
MDYGFTHEGKVFTPNGTTGIDTADNETRNKQIEAHELAAWKTCPDGVLAYYKLAAEDNPNRQYRESFVSHGIVSTWLGTQIGTITHARGYRHNFGSRMVAIQVTGTNGAKYYGRASYDWGQCVRLRLRKRQ